MLHLRGVREHRDVRGAAREGGGRGRERARVLGQRPSVDRDAEDAQPAVHEAVHQPGHRGAILLHGREPAPWHAETVHYLQHLPPREGLGASRSSRSAGARTTSAPCRASMVASSSARRASKLTTRRPASSFATMAGASIGGPHESSRYGIGWRRTCHCFSSRPRPGKSWESAAATVLTMPKEDRASCARTLVIPMYREAPRIAGTIHTLAASSLSHPGTEIILVDDGSDDDTVAVARAALAATSLAASILCLAR